MNNNLGTVSKQHKCTCGTASVGGNKHSDFCDLLQVGENDNINFNSVAEKFEAEIQAMEDYIDLTRQVNNYPIK